MYISEFGTGAIMTKVDVQSAYHLLPMRFEDFRSLGFQLQGLLYFDKMAPMGAKFSAAHWEAFGTKRYISGQNYRA